MLLRRRTWVCGHSVSNDLAQCSSPAAVVLHHITHCCEQAAVVRRDDTPHNTGAIRQAHSCGSRTIACGCEMQQGRGSERLHSLPWPAKSQQHTLAYVPSTLVPSAREGGNRPQGRHFASIACHCAHLQVSVPQLRWGGQCWCLQTPAAPVLAVQAALAAAAVAVALAAGLVCPAGMLQWLLQAWRLRHQPMKHP